MLPQFPWPWGTEARRDPQHRLILQGGSRGTWDSSPAWMLQALFLLSPTLGKTRQSVVGQALLEAGPGVPDAPPTFSEGSDFLEAFPLFLIS